VVRGVNSKITKKEERSDKKVTKIWLSMFEPIPHSKVVNCGVLKAVGGCVKPNFIIIPDTESELLYFPISSGLGTSTV